MLCTCIQDQCISLSDGRSVVPMYPEQSSRADISNLPSNRLLAQSSARETNIYRVMLSARVDCFGWIRIADLPSNRLLAQSSARETSCSGFGLTKSTDRYISYSCSFTNSSLRPCDVLKQRQRLAGSLLLLWYACVYHMTLLVVTWHDWFDSGKGARTKESQEKKSMWMRSLHTWRMHAKVCCKYMKPMNHFMFYTLYVSLVRHM